MIHDISMRAEVTSDRVDRDLPQSEKQQDKSYVLFIFLLKNVCKKNFVFLLANNIRISLIFFH